MKFAELRKNLKKDFSHCAKLRLAITADWSVQLLAQAIRGYGYERKMDIEIYEAAYDQMESELLNQDSDLYKFRPDYVLLFPCTEKFQEKFYKMAENDRVYAVENEIERIRNLSRSVRENSQAQIIICNYCEIDDGVYGNYAGNCVESLLYNLRKMNYKLCDVITKEKYSMIDINNLQSVIGRLNLVDNRLYYISKTVFSMEGLACIAEQICSVISSLFGKIKKCVVCDLDNTLWGGVVGDDGIENIQIGEFGIGKAFSDLQTWIKELSKRGIAVAICSKNDDSIAREVFEKHPDMILKLKDISVFTANWKDKATNIKNIQQVLNIGLDSMVFLDDNPFERELVRNILPEVTVPELPKDPTEYVSYLRSLNLFETVGISDADKIRTRQYQEEARRIELKNGVSSVEDYLQSLEMSADIKAFDKFTMPRVAQLTQRSNQFNLRTKRYFESELEKITMNSSYVTMSVSLKDKFGEYGIVGVAILERISDSVWFIDTFLMSCRVLKRTVEEFLFNEIVEKAKKDGIITIIGEYLPTKKNTLVCDLLGEFGFTKTEENNENSTTWLLDVEGYCTKKTFIKKG
ncbi:HAD-IIIC family phosphatase [Aminipila terrae]|uniref:HAD-IIIC family phosphatase n=1 Tax=Aminipila terrae TaxID=2697030 RepID=A0A6P1MDU0_9FIRM|nr:HAD-IIIC family phosphatase [Aminipila terrae]QHI72077.1 HAD-IIIC family phosphatase [Aminipila terrae]